MAVCVHAHFYQPPREEPSTGLVPREPSADPHHDWNHRITDQCYRPMGAARILNDDGTVDRAVNLYAKVSFNVAPTLAVWLDRYAPDVMAAMLVGDRESAVRHHGHGGAVAHPWVHAILPLASPRDRRTMILWGIADFVRRFGRRPEGMWMPETAVDTATLESLAEAGVTFTIVAPHQVAPLHRETSLDPHAPVSVTLPSGRSIVLFAYDGSIAHGVAFGDLLDDGEAFAASLSRPILTDDNLDPLHSIATDAETFGHHHVFGEMALAYALDRIESVGEDVVNYAAWLAVHGARQRGSVIDDTSWSCAHGIERWRADCGCHTGREGAIDQKWRAPLRAAVDRLVDSVAALTDRHATRVFESPWAARDAYVDVLVGTRTSAEFVDRYVLPGATAEDALGWMEAHRHLLLAQSSCGWFFDTPDGLETRLSMRQAEHAMWMLARLTGTDLRPQWDADVAPMFSGWPSARV